MCSLKEGDPPVTFDWVKDEDVATSLPGVKVLSQEFSSTLTIMAASVIHSGNYYCKASNPVSWSMIKSAVFVDGSVEFLMTLFVCKILVFKEKHLCNRVWGDGTETKSLLPDWQ